MACKLPLIPELPVCTLLRETVPQVLWPLCPQGPEAAQGRAAGEEAGWPAPPPPGQAAAQLLQGNLHWPFPSLSRTAASSRSTMPAGQYYTWISRFCSSHNQNVYLLNSRSHLFLPQALGTTIQLAPPKAHCSPSLTWAESPRTYALGCLSYSPQHGGLRVPLHSDVWQDLLSLKG